MLAEIDEFERLVRDVAENPGRAAIRDTALFRSGHGHTYVNPWRGQASRDSVKVGMFWALSAALGLLAMVWIIRRHRRIERTRSHAQ